MAIIQKVTLDLIEQKYAWPGGYPLYAICSDGEPMCPKCVKENRQQIEEAIESYDKGMPNDEEWRVIDFLINWEDEHLQCVNCGGTIESAYGEDR